MFNNKKMIKGLCIFLAVLMAASALTILFNVIL
jgi:hypothetical protein